MWVIISFDIGYWRGAEEEVREVISHQEAYKGEIQCPVLPNQICLLTNHNKFHASDLQLLLLSSNQSTVVHRK